MHFINLVLFYATENDQIFFNALGQSQIKVISLKLEISISRVADK